MVTFLCHKKCVVELCFKLFGLGWWKYSENSTKAGARPSLNAATGLVVPVRDSQLMYPSAEPLCRDLTSLQLSVNA
jgi:hypothetical protein